MWDSGHDSDLLGSSTGGEVCCLQLTCCCLSAYKASNSMQQPAPRPVQQAGRSSRMVAASGDAVQNRIDDITAQVN